MRGDDRAVQRTIAVIVLMMLATVALRGYLPGAERRPQPEELTTGSGSVVAVIAMVVVSIAVIAVAILSQALQRPARPGAGEPHREPRGTRGRLRWRPVVIATMVLLAWSVVLLLLMRWVTPPELGDAPPVADSSVPQTPEGTDQVPRQRPTGSGDTVFAILAGATTVLVVVSIVGTVFRRRRSRPSQAPAYTAHPPSQAAAPDLARAAELGLAEVNDPSRDPREAIIACYLAMERELEKSPGTSPRDSDTPSEVLARAVELHALHAGSAGELVDLFEEARFSRHVMNESHRQDAVRALTSVQRELQVTT